MLFSGLARTDNSSEIIDQNIRQGVKFKHTETDFLQTSTPVLLHASAGKYLSTCKRDCFHSRSVLAQLGWLLFSAPHSTETPPGTQPGWCSSCCSCDACHDSALGWLRGNAEHFIWRLPGPTLKSNSKEASVWKIYMHAYGIYIFHCVHMVNLYVPGPTTQLGMTINQTG